MGKAQRIKNMRQQPQQPKPSDFSGEELEALERVICPNCGGTFRITGLELRKIPMTHPKSGGQEGTAFMNVSTCLPCLIRDNITQAMMNLAKKPVGEIGEKGYWEN